jgi:hypothetical protein
MDTNILLRRITVSLKSDGLMCDIKIYHAKKCSKMIKYKGSLGGMKSLHIDKLNMVNTSLNNVIPGSMISYYAFVDNDDDIMEMKAKVRKAVFDRFDEITKQYELLKTAIMEDFCYAHKTK